MTKPKYFTLEELLRSNVALAYKIENLPSWTVIENLNELGLMLDKIRAKFGKPINITSGYRGEKLNTKVKGSKTSDHKLGKAADCTCYDNKLLFDTIKAMIDDGEIEVGQLIWEYGTKSKPDWIHVSTPSAKHKNEVLYIGVR